MEPTSYQRRGEYVRDKIERGRLVAVLGPDFAEFTPEPCFVPPGLIVRSDFLPRLVNRGGGFSKNACAWELSDRVKLIGLQLVSQVITDPAEQSQVVGFMGDQDGKRPQTSHAEADIIRCLVEGYGGFGIYLWCGVANRLRVSFTRVGCGRWCCTNGQASGDDAGYLDLDECLIEGSFGRWRGAGGSHGTGTHGLVTRGGQSTARNTRFHMIGHPLMPLVASIVNTPAPEHYDLVDWPLTTIANCTSRVQRNGSELAYDAYCDTGRIVIKGGTGSGPRGEWHVHGAVEVIDGAKKIEGPIG